MAHLEFEVKVITNTGCYGTLDGTQSMEIPMKYLEMLQPRVGDIVYVEVISYGGTQKITDFWM